MFPVVVLAVLVYVLSRQQQPLYEASAQVLLNHQDQVATSLVGVQTPAEDAGRYAVTQTLVASTPVLARRVLVATGRPHGSVTDLLNHTSVYSNADVLVFSVKDHDEALTARLASTWARQYTIYRRELDTRELSNTLDQLEARIAALRADGTSKSLYASLLAKAQDIRLLEALRQSNVYVIRTPTGADVDQIAPRPLRNTVLASGVGLLIGLLAAFLVDALDTRVRSADELEESLGLPLLGSIPGSRARRADAHAIALLGDEDPAATDAFLSLRTSVTLANVDLQATTLLIAGSGDGEDASTVAANLAAATARTGRHVVLVDLDLRDAYLSSLFGLDRHDGVTTVVLGEVPLATALVGVGIEEVGGEAPAAASPRGSLAVLGTGALPPRPGELVASTAVSSLLAELASNADVVLVVAPPLLAVGDAVALGSSADALMIVARLGVARRTRIRELRRVLAAWPTPALGFVLTGADARARPSGGSGSGLRGLGLRFRDELRIGRSRRGRSAGSKPSSENTAAEAP